MLYFFPSSVLAKGHQDHIQQIKSSPGIYFDPIGELKINVGYLDILAPVDISYISPHLENINSILGTVRFLCNQYQLETAGDLECHSILEPLSVRYNDIVSEYSSFSHLTSSSRVRRGAWLGIVGSLSKTIFGTLNEDDAIKYDNAIQSIQNNEKRLSSLIKENILVTTSTLSKLNKTFYNIKTNEVNLNIAIDDLSQKLKNISKISNDINFKVKLNSILNSLESSLLALSFQLQDITNAIMLSSQHILHPAILPPTQLYEELVDNYRHLPLDTKLPLSLELSNIHKLINVSSVVCFSLGNNIVFILKIPLVSPRQYNLFHNIALPTPHNSIEPHFFSFIKPSCKYIAMTKDKSEYCKLTSLTECKIISDDDYICDIPSVYPTSANPSCESELLSTVVSSLPVQCKTDFIHGHIDVWKPITNNRWIFVQSLNNKLFVECPKQKISEINIIGTGILSTPQNCVAFCKTTRLVPKLSNIKINVKITQSDFSIINDSCCNLLSLRQKSDEPPIKLQNVDLDIFTSDVESKFKSISDAADKIKNQHPILKYETHYSTLLVIISVSCIIFIIYKFFMLIKSHSRHSWSFPIITRATRPMSTEQNPTLNLEPRAKFTENIPDNNPSIERDKSTLEPSIPSPSTRMNI